MVLVATSMELILFVLFTATTVESIGITYKKMKEK